ncbi:TetR family transcriptional regulator [Parenemella sanctibonifatiensis]|uniref:TetR family transcriptional regulator n=1 Tax=Parenemella sanctibonifatiensis TaxID=2016505 RepID=A0A255E933_9ACTN|nr:TetR family transcriptional regulator [Parenemella sanctibonifatiensis]
MIQNRRTTVAETTISNRRAQTRERLIIAAQEAIVERGVAAASVEYICETAGFTRGAFYSNFADKDDLMAALAHHWFAEQLQRAQGAIAEATAGAGVGIDDIPAAVRLFMDVHAMSPDWGILTLELRLHALRTPEFRTVFAEAEAGIAGVIGTMLTEALADNGLELSIEPADALTILASLFTFVRTDARGRTETIEQQLSNALVTLVRPMKSASS